MPAKIKQNIENKVIELYNNGIGSTTIAKTLGLGRSVTLSILHRNNVIIRNRLLPKNYYNQFTFKNGKWYGEYKCQTCGNVIEFYSKHKRALSCTFRNKKRCIQCLGKEQQGENNPFYGKKHVQSSINKMLNTKMKKIQNGEILGYNKSKAEYEIVDVLQKKGIECISDFSIENKVFDIFIPKLNLVIEYNGDYWHCNPNKYHSEYYHKQEKKLAKEIWKRDNQKMELVKKYKYNYEVIWETEYKSNPNIVENLISKWENHLIK